MSGSDAYIAAAIILSCIIICGCIIQPNLEDENLTGVKHTTLVTKVNDGTKDVSADAWNAEHAPGATADVLTDHTKALHDALLLDAATLGGMTATAIVAAAGGTGSAWWYSGAGAPDVALGSDGDFYLRTTTNDVYSKSGGAWGAITNIQGATGATGLTGPTGPTGPTGSAGANGAAGAAGVDGADGAAGANGTNGATWYSGAGVPS
jgi:hypothetical protein